MKTPLYEPSPGALAAFLASNLQVVPVELFTLTMQSGTVLRHTNIDTTVEVLSNTWQRGPLIQRGRVRRSVGISVDTMGLTLQADDTITVNGVPIVQAFARGLFNGATVRVSRMYWDTDLVVQGVAPVFYGRVGQVETGLNQVSTEVRSHAELLDVMVPGEVYQPGCRNTLFDPQCGLSRAAWKTSATVSVGSTATRNTFSVPNTGKAAQYFSVGEVKFTSGANSGVRRMIKRHVENGAGTDDFTLVAPAPYDIAAGTTVELYPGCNKTMGVCSGTFANLARFRAEPFIPAPETVV